MSKTECYSCTSIFNPDGTLASGTCALVRGEEFVQERDRKLYDGNLGDVYLDGDCLLYGVVFPPVDGKCTVTAIVNPSRVPQEA